MSIQATPTAGAKLLSPKDHTLVMIDFQSQMAFATHSIEAITLRNNAALVAHAAAGFGVPTILTTVAEKSFSGPMFSEIADAFPGQAMLDRTSMNSWEDDAVVAEVNRIGKPRIVLAVGRFAAQSVLALAGVDEATRNQPLGKLRGQVFRLPTAQGTVPVVVSYHPAYLLRSPAEKGKAWADLCLAMAQLERAA